jgi:hypothetical protein
VQVVVRNGRTLLVVRDPKEEQLLQEILIRLKRLNERKLGAS